MRDERPLAAVPAWLWAWLGIALAVQIGWQSARHPLAAGRGELPAPPALEALRLAAFGEEAALARLLMLYLQGFDLREIDYARLIDWLQRLLALDPRSQYPLFSAARIYAENPDATRSRQALEFVYQAFFADPQRRWPWLAHAALVAKHRLRDLPLALRYARAIERHAGSDAPPWARQMAIFILEDMDELEAARIMLGDLLASGRISDPAELRFLKRRLEELEARLPGAVK